MLKLDLLNFDPPWFNFITFSTLAWLSSRFYYGWIFCVVGLVFLTGNLFTALLVLILRYQSLVQTLHSLLSVFILFALNSAFLTTLYFYTFMSSEPVHISGLDYFQTLSVSVCDAFCVDINTRYQSLHTVTNLLSFNIIYFTNTPTISTLILLSSGKSTANIYHLTNDWLTTALYLETNLLTQLNITSLLGLLTLSLVYLQVNRVSKTTFYQDYRIYVA